MFIDLSVPLSEATPVYPGDTKVAVQPGGTIARDGFEDHVLTCGTHVGTHIDAPSHMLPQGRSLAEFSLESFAGRGVLVDARRGYAEVNVASLDIHKGDAVLFMTGMSSHYGEETYFTNNPPLPIALAQFLVSKEVAIVGFDCASPDKPPFAVHKELLQANVLLLENLTNLESLVGKHFRLMAFPLRLSLDGSPVRAVAEVLDERS